MIRSILCTLILTRPRRLRRGACVATIAALILVSGAFAQSGGASGLRWLSADSSGGGTAAGGPYTLTIAIGQADAGQTSGGTFTLVGGVLAARARTAPAAGPSNRKLFLPLVVR